MSKVVQFDEYIVENMNLTKIKHVQCHKKWYNVNKGG